MIWSYLSDKKIRLLTLEGDSQPYCAHVLSVVVFRGQAESLSDFKTRLINLLAQIEGGI